VDIEYGLHYGQMGTLATDSKYPVVPCAMHSQKLLIVDSLKWVCEPIELYTAVCLRWTYTCLYSLRVVPVRSPLESPGMLEPTFGPSFRSTE